MEFKHQIELSSSVSDCESGITGSSIPSSSATSRIRRRGIFNDSVAIELEEGERSFELIRRRFIAGVGDTAVVTAVHRRNWSENSSSIARIQAFQVHVKALENKYGGGNGGGSTNMKFCWYGGDKRKIERILNHGFSFQDLLDNHGAILLSPDDSPLPSVEDSGPDEDGLRHVLLCRVLLGQSELVHLGSGQTHPSSDAFDSGVDSYVKPSKFVIWSTNMNTHILPEYIVSFKVTSPAQSPSKGVFSKTQNGIRMPTSPWISFPALISVLARYLPSDAVALISKYHKDYKEKKISRPELIDKVRHVAGDKLLISVIKSFKGVKEARVSPHNNTNNYTNN